MSHDAPEHTASSKDTGDQDARDQELRGLAAAAREINRLVRTTTAPPELLAEAAATLRRAAALLEDHVHEGPHWQLGLGRSRLRPFTDPGDFFPYSPVVGPLNPIAPPIEVQVDDEGVVHGWMTLTEPYNGPPWDLTHGGVIAQIFDELLGLATIAGGGGGYTGRLTVRFRKPTPILREVEVRAWLESSSGRKLVARGEMRHEGAVTAEAEGLFVRAGRTLADADR